MAIFLQYAVSRMKRERGEAPDLRVRAGLPVHLRLRFRVIALEIGSARNGERKKETHP